MHEVVAEGKFISFMKVDQWEYVKRNNCSDIVIILAMNEEGRIIFVEQFRPPVSQNVIEFPAGLVNDEIEHNGESYLEGAKRELLEETGYEAGEVVKVIKGPASSGSSADLVTLVYATNLKKVAEGGGVEDESIIVHEILLDEADEWLESMAQKGVLVEPKVYAGLYFLKKLVVQN